MRHYQLAKDVMMIKSFIYSIATLLTVISMAEVKWITLNHEWLQQAHHLCEKAVASLISLL